MKRSKISQRRIPPTHAHIWGDVGTYAKVVNISTLDIVNNSRHHFAHCQPGRGARLHMDRSQINRVSVADQVAALLRQRILEGEFRPGTQLQELPLAASMGVSRNTMREAIRILSLEGLLRRSLHRGAAVSQLAPEDVREIYQLRRMFELAAVFAARPRSEVVQELHGTVEHYEQAVRARNWSRAVNHDLHFHSLLIRFHDNKRLDAFYKNMLVELRVAPLLPGVGDDLQVGEALSVLE